MNPYAAFGLPPRSVRAALAITLTAASIALTALQIPAAEIHALTGSSIAFYFSTSGKDGST